MDLIRLRLPELRYELSRRNLDTTGSKVVLISRLQFELDKERRMSENSEVQSEISVLNIETDQNLLGEVSNDESSIETQSNDRILAANENSWNENRNTATNAAVIGTSAHRENIANEADNFNTQQRSTVNSNSNDISESNPPDLSPENPDSPDTIDIEMTDSNAESRKENDPDTVNVFAPGDKVKYTLMQGDRKNSEVLYSHDEQQFYVKNKTQKSGIITLRCQHSGCNRKVYLDKKKEMCTYELPYKTHNHSTMQKKFAERTFKNAIKTECSKPDILASISTKTAAVRTIFSRNLQE